MTGEQLIAIQKPNQIGIAVEIEAQGLSISAHFNFAPVVSA